MIVVPDFFLFFTLSHDPEVLGPAMEMTRLRKSTKNVDSLSRLEKSEPKTF
jgi:hypothetical protein